MQPLNQSDEANWLASRTEALCVAGRARQRKQRDQMERDDMEFSSRLREDRLLVRGGLIVLLVMALCLVALIVAFAPVWWDCLKRLVGGAA